MPLRPEKFYQNRNIELMLAKTVINVDITTKTITFQDQDTLQYDKVLLATGGIPRKLDVPGADLPNVVTLRSLDDADALIHDCEHAARIVVIGASFIGLESAFSLKQRGLDVTVTAPEKVPFASIFGEEIGAMLQQSYAAQRIHFQLGNVIEAIEGENYARAVVLKNGERIEADLFLSGVGVTPNTGYLQGLDVQSDGSIQVDEYFQAAADVYAAGDIVRFPDWRSRNGIRIEHWRTAEQQGRDAARNMAGKQVANQSVPFFWSKQTDFNIRYVGHVKDWEEVIIDGDVASKKFLAFYIKHGKVYAVAGAKRDQEMAAIHELMRLNKMPTPEELRGKSLNMLDLVK
ncbi:MAG: FAD-dependent oxidoreductase [Candidatus Vecturithrix sp.]|jgi:NADPH-dependent 2,4-dienoyl-CoA reductase/sulfur reductase-like enzyme|nr:FAD-dependent oxidoreductase [Candidatus Vecturithrix sp.]